MQALIMANGDYCNLNWYRSHIEKYSYVICSDGGANTAKLLGIVPDIVIGDLDSINEPVRSLLGDKGVRFINFPHDKDYTDTFLALNTAEKEGFSDIVIWGGTGGRLDHTLANLQNAATFAKKGVSIRFESPVETIYIIRNSLNLKGSPGDTVSVLALSERAEGVTLTGFKYPLINATLEFDQPIGISNIIDVIESEIQLDSGILAVFHNHASGL